MALRKKKVIYSGRSVVFTIDNGGVIRDCDPYAHGMIGLSFDRFVKHHERKGRYFKVEDV
jgi:hypothetical protein